MTDDQQHALQEQRHREALAVEMAGLRADAERYRWLRLQARIDSCGRGKRTHPISFQTIFADAPMDGGNYRDRFDAAIDAAMKGGK
jgi:hypothetical protein